MFKEKEKKKKLKIKIISFSIKISSSAGPMHCCHHRWLCMDPAEFEILKFLKFFFLKTFNHGGAAT
jgi:hypothetical protein